MTKKKAAITGVHAYAPEYILSNQELETMIETTDVSVDLMKQNNLTSDDIAWFVPHQANLRIIDAVSHRMVSQVLLKP